MSLGKLVEPNSLSGTSARAYVDIIARKVIRKLIKNGDMLVPLNKIRIEITKLALVNRSHKHCALLAHYSQNDKRTRRNTSIIHAMLKELELFIGGDLDKLFGINPNINRIHLQISPSSAETILEVISYQSRKVRLVDVYMDSITSLIYYIGIITNKNYERNLIIKVVEILLLL